MTERYLRQRKKFKQKSSTLMSNKKWIKFFNIMTEFSESLCYYKTIECENFTRGVFPYSSLQIYDTFLEDGLFGAPCEYEIIEWILIPIKAYSPMSRNTIYEDIKAGDILTELSKKGIFPIEHVTIKPENGITIYKTFVIYDYLIIKGYNRHSEPPLPKPRRGPAGHRQKQN
ncbi:MAG: hypothetical protein Q8K60_08465 [Parachlamydiaceae bacterium]|nr:hypothetical protein [Parachlamydiaceae bacterium]